MELKQDHVIRAIKSTNNSSPGPVGIPFVAYHTFIDVAAPIIYKVAELMQQGETPPQDFNYGNLFIIPKDNTIFIEKTRPSKSF